MRNVGGGEPYRFVVDESSFDFRELTEIQLADVLDEFNGVLAELSGQHRVAVSPFWIDTECGAGGRDLYQILYESSDPEGHDERLLMGTLMDRCPSWDTELPGLADQVTVDGGESRLALSLGYVLWQGLRGHRVGCLVLPSSGRRGWRPVTAGESGTEAFFFSDTVAVPEFWRELFVRENVQECDFFARVTEAFPELVFADSLTFRKFDGSYAEHRDWVVHVLSVVHDHFANALAAHPGNMRSVQQELGSHGLSLSPESPNTRSKKKIMKQRDVVHEGEVYQCEWHAKQHPARNRVHFSLPEQRLGERILIGIFVDHLDTE